MIVRGRALLATLLAIHFAAATAFPSADVVLLFAMAETLSDEVSSENSAGTDSVVAPGPAIPRLSAPGRAPAAAPSLRLLLSPLFESVLAPTSTEAPTERLTLPTYLRLFLAASPIHPPR